MFYSGIGTLGPIVRSGWMVISTDFWSRGPGTESRWTCNSVHGRTTFLSTTLPPFHSQITSEKNGNNIFPKPGIEPGPLDSKSYTLPRRYKSQLVPQGSTSVLYAYTRWHSPPSNLKLSLNFRSPRITWNETQGVLCTRGLFTVGAKCNRWKNGNIFPRPGIEPGPLDSKSYTLPRRYKSRLVPQGSTSVSYIYIRWHRYDWNNVERNVKTKTSSAYTWYISATILKADNFSSSASCLLSSRPSPFWKCVYSTSRKHPYIILTPSNPTFYIVKLWFTGLYIIFSYFCSNHRLWLLVRTVSPR